MPSTTDPVLLRNILETDRAWSVYALGDLAPGFFEQSSWWVAPSDPPALALLYRGLDPPVLFTLGPAAAVGPLLDEMDQPRQLMLQVRTDVVPLLRRRYQLPNLQSMWRMLLLERNQRPARAPHAVQLGSADMPALERLYADGVRAGEQPNAFAPSMLAQGVFFGVREGSELIAVAGTHLVATEVSVAAMGNIYTRRDRRKRGLASGLTSLLARELFRMGVRTVALNVQAQNIGAVRVYERLGFVRYCPFGEGLAVRAADRAPDAPG